MAKSRSRSRSRSKSSKTKNVDIKRLKEIINRSDKPEEDKKKFMSRIDAIANGRRDVYCVSARKKVPLESNISGYLSSMGKGRTALGISGYSKKCTSKSTGKQVHIHAMITNVPSSAVSGAARARARSRSKSRSKSRSRSKSKSPRRKRKRSPSKRKSRSRK